MIVGGLTLRRKEAGDGRTHVGVDVIPSDPLLHHAMGRDPGPVIGCACPHGLTDASLAFALHCSNGHVSVAWREPAVGSRRRSRSRRMTMSCNMPRTGARFLGAAVALGLVSLWLASSALATFP